MITDLTRRDLIDLFNSYDPEPVMSMLAGMSAGTPPRRGIYWWGRLDESEFLARLYDLEALQSQDPRFTTAGEDIWQHRQRNLDWDDDWVFYDARFELATSDEKLLRFLAETLHPTVRSHRDEVERLRAEYNRILRPDRVEIRQVSTISGRPVFAGGPATPRSIESHTLRRAIGEAIGSEFKAYDVEAYCDEIRIPSLPPNRDASPDRARPVMSSNVSPDAPGRNWSGSLERCRTAAPTGTLKRCSPRSTGVAGRALRVHRRTSSSLPTLRQAAKQAPYCGQEWGIERRARPPMRCPTRLSSPAASSSQMFKRAG